MKKRVIAKLGTNPSCEIVLWDDNPLKEGDWIYAMKAEVYDSLHSSWRKIKNNGHWKQYVVDKLVPVLFVHLI